MSAEIVVAGILTALLAASCYSVTGFGFALVMTPLLTLAWDVKPAVVTSVILSTTALVPLLLQVRASISISRVSVLIAGSVIGIPVGVFVLDRVDPDVLTVVVAAAVIVAGVLLYVAPAMGRGEDTVRGRLATGFVSGALGASTSLSGPPVVLYLLGRERDIDSFRATTMAFFLPGNLITIAAFAAIGRVTGDVVLMAGAALPALGAGLVAGSLLRRRIDPDRFRFLVLGVLVFASSLVLASTVGKFG
jgi:uncharacterized membrane protein YfcA